MISPDRLKALKEDLKNAHNIACETGLFLYENPETSSKEGYFWALAKGLYDVLEYILRELGEW